MTTTDFNCSFCGLGHRQVEVMISGPRCFICNACVQLCCDVLVERKAEGTLTTVSEHVPVLANLDKRIHEMDLENGRLRRDLGFIAESIRRCFPYAIKCMWCEVKLDNEELAKEHVATCEKHPAVVALAEERSRVLVPLTEGDVREAIAAGAKERKAAEKRRPKR